jgi:hypothetical protein
VARSGFPGMVLPDQGDAAMMVLNADHWRSPCMQVDCQASLDSLRPAMVTSGRRGTWLCVEPCSDRNEAWRWPEMATMSGLSPSSPFHRVFTFKPFLYFTCGPALPFIAHSSATIQTRQDQDIKQLTPTHIIRKSTHFTSFQHHAC